jgi:AcrR family transcriptional regulator
MNTLEKIQKSALKIFVERGFTASTLLITKDAGVSTGILFKYFPTKNELIISLYSQFVAEFYNDGKRMKSALNNDNIINFSDLHKQVYLDRVNWSLDNWEKFKYIELFETTLLTNQIGLIENEYLNETHAYLADVMKLGIQHGIYRDIPIEFHISNLTTYTNSTIKFLHSYPQYRYDQRFIDQAWQIYWSMAAA